MNGGRPPTGPEARRVRPVRHRRTFEQLRTSPRRGRSGPLAVSYVEQKAWSEPQIAYAIGRRTGTAVARNRLRRRLRAIAAGAAPTLQPGAYLVRAAPEAAELGFDRLRTAMDAALDRATSSVDRVPRSGSEPAEPTGSSR